MQQTEASLPAGTSHGHLPKGSSILLNVASLVVVIAGLKAAGSLLPPILISAILAMVLIPPMRWLRGKGLPSPLAVLVVLLAAGLAIALVSLLVGNSVQEFQTALPEYEAKLSEIVHDSVEWLRGKGLNIPENWQIRELVDSGSLMQLVADTTAGLLGAISNILLVLLTMLFMLAEANDLPKKLQKALGHGDGGIGRLDQIGRRVFQYVSIKAAISLFNGVLVAVLLLILGVDFAFLWGLVVFLFNFIPNIGSVISMVPIVLLALLQLGFSTALAAAVGMVAIDQVVGNLIEPRLMGRKLGLSTLVIFLSLIFWNWVWGPVGMLLSVPLTVILKIVLEETDDFRPVAVLLGPGNEADPAAAEEASQR